MTIKELEKDTRYKYHHTATHRGYISRKIDCYVGQYKGRFGEGYVVSRPRWDTTQYYYVDYYIKNE